MKIRKSMITKQQSQDREEVTKEQRHVDWSWATCCESLMQRFNHVIHGKETFA